MVGCIIYTYQHGGNKMAKYEIRKYDYSAYTKVYEYAQEFNTFAELKSYIINNKNTEIVYFGEVYKNDEYLFNPQEIFEYIEDAKFRKTQFQQTKPLTLKSLLEYSENSFSIVKRSS